LLARPLRADPAILAQLQGFFAARNRPMPERNRVQALVPEGATVLPNPHGTAPGLAIEVNPNPLRAPGGRSWLLLLPGPPRELRPMFNDSVAPLLARVLPQATRATRTLCTTGVGESLVQARVAPLLQPLLPQGLDVGYCAQPGRVDVRLAAQGETAAALVREATTRVRAELGLHVFAEGEEELESVVVRLLTERERTLAVAESCTGGCVAHRLTNVPGASAVFLAGLVTYSNEAKQKFLGVQAETLAQHGAVSEPVARAMAEGARRQNRTTYALAVTGIAGPAGGTLAKPVGTVFTALAGPSGTVVEKNFNPLDRETFKQVTAQQALDLLRRHLLQAGGE
jgi:nicotinamide-nucleotide amidase